MSVFREMMFSFANDHRQLVQKFEAIFWKLRYTKVNLLLLLYFVLC